MQTFQSYVMIRYCGACSFRYKLSGLKFHWCTEQLL